jgi:hypothetical protein
VSGAEVVEGDPHPVFLQGDEVAQHQGRIAGQRRLGQFDRQRVARQVRGRECPGDPRHEPAVHHLTRRDVDADRQVGPKPAQAGQLADGLPQQPTGRCR